MHHSEYIEFKERVLTIVCEDTVAIQYGIYSCNTWMFQQ